MNQYHWILFALMCVFMIASGINIGKLEDGRGRTTSLIVAVVTFVVFSTLIYLSSTIPQCR